MIHVRLSLLTLAIFAASLGGCAASHARPEPIAGPTAAELESSIERGIAFLVKRQNPDGSWGSARRTKGLNITAPIPGAHRGFRGATTAMCVAALTEAADLSDPAVANTLRRGEEWILAHYANIKRGSQVTIYSNWAHAYGLTALAHMHLRAAGDSPRQAKIADLIALQYKRLTQNNFLGGGWGYYDFEHHTANPAGQPTSFTTAAVLVGMRDAADAGFPPPPGLLADGVREVLRQRRPDGSFFYSRNWRYRPTGKINQAGGALGRVQSCNAALRVWGNTTEVTDALIAEWLDRLFARNGWLSIGRKRPRPHESWFAVAGYFYYFGHFYAGHCIDLLPPEQRPFYQAHQAATLMALQEADGSWWDFPLYDYHQPYGTAFALMSLNRCRVVPPEPSVADGTMP